MINKPLVRIAGHILLAASSLVLFIFVIKLTLSDWPSIELRALDRLRPETFKYLSDVKDKNRLRIYETYFLRVNQQFKGTISEILGLLGYCAYQRGDLKEAVRRYEQAINKNPDFFWFYFNLASINLEMGNFENTAHFLKKALDLDMKDSLSFILSSNRVYLPIIKDTLSAQPQDELIQQLNAGYRQALLMLLLVKNKQSIRVGILIY